MGVKKGLGGRGMCGRIASGPSGLVASRYQSIMPLVTNILSEQSGPDALFQDPVPLQDVQSEKPWHRLAIMLAARGSTVTEIACKLERSISWVSLLLRQPWARERLTQEIMAEGRDELDVLIKGASAEAFRQIKSLSEVAESEAVRLAAAREILDRHLGKPVQKVEQKNTNLNLDINSIEKEIKALEEQERQLLGGRAADTLPSEVVVGHEDTEKALGA